MTQVGIDRYDWARRVAMTIHRYYEDAWDHLEQEHDDERWEAMADGWETRFQLMVEMHVFALRRLEEYMADHPRLAHLGLHEFFVRNDAHSFAEDFWENRLSIDTRIAQALVHQADDGEGILVGPSVAARIWSRYGNGWADLSDEEFDEVWRMTGLEVSHDAQNRVFPARLTIDP